MAGRFFIRSMALRHETGDSKLTPLLEGERLTGIEGRKGFDRS
jgi:hypothetical protein